MKIILMMIIPILMDGKCVKSDYYHKIINHDHYNHANDNEDDDSHSNGWKMDKKWIILIDNDDRGGGGVD